MGGTWRTMATRQKKRKATHSTRFAKLPIPAMSYEKSIGLKPLWQSSLIHSMFLTGNFKEFV